jgi:hypothetical protein
VRISASWPGFGRLAWLSRLGQIGHGASNVNKDSPFSDFGVDGSTDNDAVLVIVIDLVDD